MSPHRAQRQAEGCVRAFRIMGDVAEQCEDLQHMGCILVPAAMPVHSVDEPIDEWIPMVPQVKLQPHLLRCPSGEVVALYLITGEILNQEHIAKVARAVGAPA